MAELKVGSSIKIEYGDEAKIIGQKICIKMVFLR